MISKSICCNDSHKQLGELLEFQGRFNIYVIQWLSFVAVFHICILFIVFFYIDQASSFLFNYFKFVILESFTMQYGFPSLLKAIQWPCCSFLCQLVSAFIPHVLIFIMNVKNSVFFSGLIWGLHYKAILPKFWKL